MQKRKLGKSSLEGLSSWVRRYGNELRLRSTER